MDERAALGRWSSWGATPEIFDPQTPAWRQLHIRLRELLNEDEYRAARRTTLNAHYTDPVIAARMWELLSRLGFGGGEVLEPGCGSGTFMGLAPPGTAVTGIELDPATARITAALYPSARVVNEGFERTHLRRASFDAAIGNVPFSDVRLEDPIDNPGRHSMHNHFIVKALKATRPGGVVALISTHHTLDARNPAARREMAEYADLLAAIRLPGEAHKRTAGTTVLTDILLFARHDRGAPDQWPHWCHSGTHTIDGLQVRVNQVFDTPAGHVCGIPAARFGRFGPEPVVHEPPGGWPARLGQIVDSIAERLPPDVRYRPREGRIEQSPSVVIAPDVELPGQVRVSDSGDFETRSAHGEWEPLTPPIPGNGRAEARHLLALRDLARQLIRAETVAPPGDEELETLRAQLRKSYDAYSHRHGPINRVKHVPTSRVDEETGQPVVSRRFPTPITRLRNDPFISLVRSLEIFDEETGQASPAAILRTRVVVPRAPIRGAESAADALAVSLDTTGRVDLRLIADLLGTTDADARSELAEMVFDDPHSHRLVLAAEYLSGDVRTKLDLARAAAASDPRFVPNVEALERVQPPWLTSADITAKLGAPWIPASDVEQFTRELLNDPSARVENPAPGVWSVVGSKWSVAATSKWGTDSRPAPDLVKSLCTQTPIIVRTRDAEGREIVNTAATLEAQEKAEAIAGRFADWVWEDPHRAVRIETAYNRAFNSLVLRDYSTAGRELQLPGLAKWFTPFPHQRAAIARMIAEPTVGLFHEVGAGKTAEMAIGAMELKRLGLVRKPVVVVPNHMLEQFSREWLQLYPAARLLCASSEQVKASERRTFVARAAAHDWDAVIMTAGSFGQIGVQPRTEAGFLRRRIDDLEAVASDARSGRSPTVKELERRKLQLETRLRQLMDKQTDAGLSFEETGIDYVIVDEAHAYKNLETDTRMRGVVGNAKSKRATDLEVKLTYLREKHGPRVATFATATPIANAIAEAHVMCRLLRPDILDAAGVAHFDSWAATFGETVTKVEVSPTGSYRLSTRFARFKNVPELLRMWNTFADVQTAEDLQLPRPDVAPRDSDGRRAAEIVTVPVSDGVESVMAWIGERAGQVAAGAVDPAEDNMLRISYHGRCAALDPRLVPDPDPGVNTSPGRKLDRVADRVLAVWRETRDRQFPDVEGDGISPRLGGLQLVFCDLGTPGKSPDRFSVYTELKQLLIDGGIPADQVRFIHEAGNDMEKARMFAAARDGRIAVLFGSTEKMGVGTNVQHRAVALHHVDPPWRPADVAQRDGRIVRQGNCNSEVQLFRYVTENSFDAYMWQTLARKAEFINQLYRGNLDMREIEDIGDAAIDATEAMALATGNPLLIDLAATRAEVDKLGKLAGRHEAAQRDLARRVEAAEADVRWCRETLPHVKTAVARLQDTRGELFRMTIDDRVYTDRRETAVALRQWVRRRLRPYLQADEALGTVGTVAGVPITIEQTPRFGSNPPGLRFTPAEVKPAAFQTSTEKFLADGGSQAVQALERACRSIPDQVPQLDKRITAAMQVREDAKALLGRPFPKADQLAAATRTLAQVETALGKEQCPSPDFEHQTAPYRPAVDLTTGAHAHL